MGNRETWRHPEDWFSAQQLLEDKSVLIVGELHDFSSALLKDIFGSNGSTLEIGCECGNFAMIRVAG